MKRLEILNDGSVQVIDDQPALKIEINSNQVNEVIELDDAAFIEAREQMANPNTEFDLESKAFVYKPIEPEEPALDDKISIGE